MVIFLLVDANINNIIDDNNRVMISIIWKLVGVMHPKMATGNPRTIQILKMLLPMMFPSKMSCSFFIDDIIVVTSSGRDVPIAIMVNDITLSYTPRVVAIWVALSTTNSLPKMIDTSPNAVNIRAVLVLYLDFSLSSSILFLEIDII